MPELLLLVLWTGPWVGLIVAGAVLYLHNHDLYHHSHDPLPYSHVHDLPQHDHPVPVHDHQNVSNHDHPHDHAGIYSEPEHTHSLERIMVEHVHSWVMDGTAVGPDERVMIRYRCSGMAKCSFR